MRPPLQGDPASGRREQSGLLRLLFGLAAGPSAWAAQLLLDYGLSSYACFPNDAPRMTNPPGGWTGERAILLVISGTCLALAMAGLQAAHAAWRAAPPSSRTRFMALCGMLSSGVFAIAVVFGLAVAATVPACWEIRR